ncbi:MAG: GNAT family N-acetyltransferase [Deltaproteobacteria bacterium]|nr:GNAT family N-acetyltransferase [Deltaproteobacteria bacterium]
MAATDHAARVEELLDFVAAHPTRRLDRQSAGWVIDEIGLRNDNLVELSDEGRRFLVAVLFADMDNPAAAAELYVLGYAPSLGTAEQLDGLVTWAEDRARLSQARGLEVSLLPVLGPLELVLRNRGYELAYRLLFMQLDDLAASPLLGHEPPADLHFVDLSEANVDAGHECYRRAFAATSGSQIPDRELFREVMVKAEHKPRQLMSGTRVVAFSRVTWQDEAARLGEVRTVARDPDFPRKGLGTAALAEGLRTLQRLGATSACLEVASDNVAAVGLYQKHGFRTDEVAQVFRRAL